MDFQLILAAGVGTGTILLFAAIGEIFAERSGVLNLGVEGMMLIGAVAGYSTVVASGNPWLALVVAMIGSHLLGLPQCFPHVGLLRTDPHRRPALARRARQLYG